MRHIFPYVVIVFAFAAAACHSSTATSPTAAALSGVTLSASTIASGLTVTGTVTLDAAAPSAGAVVTLASSSDAVTVPATVTIASGSTNQTFDVLTTPATVPFTVTITATYGDISRTATLMLGKLALQSLSVSPTSVIGGAPAAGTITLTAPAPPGGVQLTLASDSPLARVPPVVTVPDGETGQTFPIDTKDSAAPAVVAITATLPYSGSTRTSTLTIGRIGVETLWLGIASVPGGLPISGTVTLTVAAPADLVVTLSSNSDSATVPPSVTVPAGASSQVFDIATVNAPPTRTATIAAAYGNTRQTATLTVFAYPVLAGLTCSSTAPVGGTTIQCTVRLSDPAPPGGWQIAIASNDDSLAGAVPSTVTVPASSLSFEFEVVTAPVPTAMSTAIRIIDAPSGLVLFTQALTINPSS